VDHVLETPTVDGGVEAFRSVGLEKAQLFLGVSSDLVYTQGEEVSAEGRFDDGGMVLSGDTNRATSTCISPRKHYDTKTQK
jgi:hypothetical protein